MEPDSPSFLSQIPQLIIISILLRQKFLVFYWCCFLLWYQSTLLWQKDTTWQGRVCFLLCVCFRMCVYTCALLEKKLAYYPATGIKRIYPQVWNLLFPKLFGENK